MHTLTTLLLFCNQVSYFASEGLCHIWPILLPVFAIASQKGEKPWCFPCTKWSSYKAHAGEFLFLCDWWILQSIFWNQGHPDNENQSDGRTGFEHFGIYCSSSVIWLVFIVCVAPLSVNVLYCNQCGYIVQHLTCISFLFLFQYKLTVPKMGNVGDLLAVLTKETDIPTDKVRHVLCLLFI